MSEHATSPHLERLTAELAALEQRIAALSARGLYIVQFIILVFGGAAVAATQAPEALAALPIFWGMWTMFTQQTDRDTQKMKAYAGELEKAANAELERLGEPEVYQFRSVISSYQPREDLLVYTAPATYFAAMQIAAWAAAVWVLWIGEWRWTLWPFGVVGFINWAAQISAEVNRKKSASIVETTITSLSRPINRPPDELDPGP